jgi:uncharacterized repeat protein (TIGR02543 family)
LEQGDWMAFDALEELATGNDLSDPDAWADFQRTVDVDNFAMATVAQGWIGNTDWWYNNIRMWRPHDDDGRWRWMVYDFGHGWTDYNYDHLAVSVVTSSPGMRVGNALQSEEFRIALVNAHADMINTTMAGSNARAIVEALADEVRPVMPLQRERWCGGETMSAWESYVDYAALFAERRADVVAAGVARHLAPGGTVSLSLTADPPSAGRFQLRVVTVDSGFEGAYYRDTPVTVTVAPAEGYTFTGWSEGAGGSDPSVTLGMDADTTLIAHFE